LGLIGKGEKMNIGKRLKSIRLQAGLSQRELAEKVGISAQTISKYERGLDTPGSADLIRLAKAFGVRVEYFFRPINITPHSDPSRDR
jgi:transcriptional regulator with XRE-family HTH domain